MMHKLLTIAVLGSLATGADAENWPVTLHGYADAGVVFNDRVPGWLDGGMGRGRYGADVAGERNVEFVLPEAAAIADIVFGPSISGTLHLKYDDDQHHVVDVAEAWLLYRSPPSPGLRWRVKAGTFLPPISLENRAIGWTSPYTLSSSALNAWVGEELRTNGVELHLLFTHGETEFDVNGAVFFANDPAGTLLAMRGWAVHDRELALFDRARIPDIFYENISPLGPFRLQSRYYEPLHETDGRPGIHAGLDIENPDWGHVAVFLYDNRADPTTLAEYSGQYAWHTRFVSIGYRGEIMENTTLIIQAMYGNTQMGGYIPVDEDRRAADVDFLTAFALLSRDFDRWRLSLRGEYFETQDRDYLRTRYLNDEDGGAVTGTVQYRVLDNLRLAVEAQYLAHDRPVRKRFGAPPSIHERSLRANLRWFF